MKKFSFKEVAVPAITLFLIAAICTAILAVTDSVTSPKIAENNEQAEIAARQLVFEDAKSFSDVKTVEDSAYVVAASHDRDEC